MIEQIDRWHPWHVDNAPTPGPDRVYDNAPTDEKRRPVGFAPPATEVEPMLWEGQD